MKESRKTFVKELTIAIVSLLLAITIYTQYRAYQKEQREAEQPTESVTNN